MKHTEIRKKFFDFFIKRGHTEVPSSSLIPAQDPTLLFTNAGMNQFKDVFLGEEKRSYTRAVSIQKCMRAGGKHSDLDNVGFTKRHLTFFEMMGNFSFGDYFKKEAIEFAWDFLVNEMGLPADEMNASVFETDDESYDIWHKTIGLPKERIYRLGAAENFWQMGDTGPCGPCTELHIDRGPEFGCKEKCDPSCECDRFLEVWNLVFMQYDRQPDGTDKPLKQTGVDTGMGLERLCVISQNKDSVFEIDLFASSIKKIEELTGKKYSDQSPELKAAFHVLLDHIRAACFLIADGCSPSNDGRGYVLRKVIRRAALFEQKLTDKSIFPALARTFVKEMGAIYPELTTNESLIVSMLESEIGHFSANLIRGSVILEDAFVSNLDTKIIPGKEVFRLYDTFGFPIELVIARAKEKGFTVDEQGFEKEMAKQREQSGKKVVHAVQKLGLPESVTTEFTGYQEIEGESEILALIQDNTLVKTIEPGQECWVITKQTPFFVSCGGQVGDTGWIIVGDTKSPVEDLKNIGKAIAVKIKAPAKLSVGNTVLSQVNKNVRLDTMKNHTATHLLQAALIEMFGKQIKQSGSVVTPDYLRFDFTHHKNLSPEEIRQVEKRVNEKIMENIPVDIFQTTYKKAIDRGVIAIFGEKYNPEQVRVIDIPGFSAELCGGTHVYRTGDIGAFKITESSALSAGNRRIFAVTGPKAVKLMQDDFETVKALSQDFKVKPDEVRDAVAKQKEQLKTVQAQLKQLKKQLWHAQVPVWEQQVKEINTIPFLFLGLEGYGNDELREIISTLQKKKSGFYFVISNIDGRSLFVTTIAKEHATKLDFAQFGAWLKDTCNLRGGGKGSALQGGGPAYDKNLEAAITEWVIKNS